MKPLLRLDVRNSSGTFKGKLNDTFMQPYNKMTVIPMQEKC